MAVSGFGSARFLRLSIIFIVLGLYALTGFSEEEPEQHSLYNFTPVLDERCTINILNGSTRVDEDGSFALLTPLSIDVPYRARAICNQDGHLLYGESALIYGVANGESKVEEIFFDRFNPIPVTLSIESSTTFLDVNTPAVSLQVFARLPNGSVANLTPSDTGMVYSSSSDAVSVTKDGLVTANRSGRAIVSARYEGVMASVEFQVFFPLDSDGDGMPDDYEIRNGLDPHNAADALADIDGDGLTNLEEYLLGTSPIHADTDGDTLTDAEELAYGTDPLLPDSDADGLIDGEEILRGTNPLSADTDNDGLSDSVEIQFGLDPLIFTPTTSIAGRVVDDIGSTVAAASVVVFNTFSSVTNNNGAFLIERVPVVAGEVSVSARIIRGGQILDGHSQALQLQEAVVAQAGDIVLQPVLGELFGTVKNPRGEAVPGARITITAQDGSDQRFINADYQGMFQVQGLPQGLINVVAQDPRTGLYGSASGTLTNNSNLQLDIALRALGTVQGKVLQADGATSAGEGRIVTLTRIGGGYNTSLITNAFGEYQATFVPLGEYVVEAYGSAKQRARTTVVLSGTTQVNDANLIFLGTGTVSGYVETSNGIRVANLPVQLSSNGIFPEIMTTTTNSVGEFVFNQVYVGDFYISATDKPNKLTGSVAAALDFDGQRSDVSITLSMTSILEGTVRLANGDIAVGAEVSFQDQKTTSNSSGFYRFEHVPLGTLVIVAKANSGEHAKFNVINDAPNQTIQKDIQLIGVGSLEVTVTNSKGATVPGVQLSLSQANMGVKNVITGSNGKAIFNSILATEFSVTAFDPIDRLGAHLASTMIAGEQVAATMVLESAGDILGVIYRADGITPASNITVQLSGRNKSVSTGSDGRYQFNMLPIAGSPYRVLAKDSQGVIRAQSPETRLQLDGEQALVDLTLIGDGAVFGRVFNPDNQVAKGVTVSLRSHVNGAKALTAVTNVNGEYRFPRIPVGTFSIEAVNQVNRFAGERTLTLEYNEQELTADIVMEENRLPSQASIVASLQDGNGFVYPVLRNGAIADGTRSVFAGDSGVYRGAGRLDITANDEILIFENAAAALEQQGQQTRLEKHFSNGLQVVRKTFVSPTGYFARGIEQFTNTSSEVMHVSARLDSHYRIATYDRTVNGSTRRVSVPVGIITSSSGDTFLNISSGVADRWVLLDDDMDVDPFNEANMPTVVHLFDGKNASVSLANGEFLSGTSGEFNRLRVNWDLAIAPGESVAVMHFTVQQTDRVAALDTINRLEQLPPEALIGISAQERQAIVNFDVPEVSNVAELPDVFGNISGHVYEHDGTTAVPSAWVSYKSSAPLFKRTWRVRTDKNGVFSFVGRKPTSNMGLVPINGFNLNVQHPHSGTITQANFDVTEFSNNSAAVDVSFGNTSIIRGTVRRYDGVVASYGYVELMGDTLIAAVKTSIAEDGEYRFSGVQPGSYQLIATLPDPNGTAIGGSIDVQLPANVLLVRDIALAQVSGVSGHVFNGAGHVEAGVVVKITAPGFSRNTRTDSGGFYEFLDMPLGDFEVSVSDPSVTYQHKHAVSVVADQMVQQNIQLISVGQLTLLANYDDGSFANNALVQIQTGDSGWRTVGRVSALGLLQINNIPVGSWSVRISNGSNNNLYTEQSGVIQSHGQQQQIMVEIPKDYPPKVTILSPESDREIMVGERVNLNVQVEDDYGLAKVDYYIGDRWLTTTYQTPFNANVLLEVVAGTNYIRAVATDVAGNKAEHSVQIKMVQDNQAPEVHWTAPIANSQFIEGKSFNYQFSATDNIGVRDVSLYINGELFRTFNATNGSGSVSIPADYATLANTMQLVLRARDYAGNQGTAELTVQILNDELPTVSLLSAPAEGSSHLEGTVVNITVAASDDVGITRVDLMVNNEVVQSRFNAPYQFSLTIPLLESITNPLVIRARAYDTLNQQQDSQPLNLIVQKNMPPQVQWLQPSDLAQFYEGQLIAMRANASDDVALSHVDFYVGGILVATDSVAPYEANYRLPGGAHNTEVQLRATAVDSINQSTSVLRTVVRLDDLVAPSVSISAPADNGIISLGESDVVIVIDTSGSASASSGADVNGDGYNDSILAAEVYAAKQLLNFLNPLTTRVAIVDFESSATLMLGLTDDFEEADRILDRILAMGASGGTDFNRAMNVATTELMGLRSRPGATPVQLFMSDGDASHPNTEIQRAVEAGIIVNTFAVGYGASTSALQNIASGTGGVATVVPDASRIVEILPRTILFGLDSLIAVADASDNVAVKEVEISAQTLAGAVLGTHIDNQAPFSAALALPIIDQPLEVMVSATAVDYGNNQAHATPIKVTLLPAQTSPTITRLDPAYARNNDLIRIKGQFLAASNNTTPSVQNPNEKMMTRAFIAGEEVPIISATKGEAQIRFPANTGSSEVWLEVDGVRTNSLMLYQDSDLDGLSDEDELLHNTDPNNRDTDGDGLWDGAEVNQYQTNPLSADSDADGLPDSIEIQFGLNPNDASDASLDLDNDGLTNLQEYQLGTSIRYADTDSDGLTDGLEVELGTNPLNWDSDGDNLNDGSEIYHYNTNPLSTDTDGDGLSDYYEIDYGLNPRISDADEDADGDGLTNAEEYALGTSPSSRDTDGDGLSDYDELYVHNTRPTYWDTDGDGDSDGLEISKGTDPNDARSSVTVGFYHSMFDGANNEWVIHNNGSVNSSGLYSSRGMRLFINGYEYNDADGRAERDGNNQIIVRPSPYYYAYDAQVSRKIFVSTELPFIRYFETITNTSTVDRTYNVQITDNYVHSSSTFNIVQTSSGDTTVDDADDFIIVDDNNLSGYHAVAHWWSDAAAAYRPSTVQLSSRTVNVTYSVHIPAGGSINLVHFAARHSDRSELISILQTMQTMPEALFAGLGVDEINGIANLALVDTDGDGLMNIVEQWLGTDINNADTDGDGLNDYFEHQYGFNPLVADDPNSDFDGDGLSLQEEMEFGTNPALADSDGDGLNDGDEHRLGTKPWQVDSDNDGLSDGDEVHQWQTNPLAHDTDGDGIADYDEVMVYTTNPRDRDSDGDGLEDWVELEAGLDPLDASDAIADFDGDGLTNAEEIQYGTDIWYKDTDGDGLSDTEEILVGTDPRNHDTDGDGDSDYVEVTYGSNPLDPSSSISVSLPLWVEDGDGYEWRLNQHGYFDQVMNPEGYEQGLRLAVNKNGWYNGFWSMERAVRVADNSFAFIEPRYSEVSSGVDVSRIVHVSQQQGFLRYLETFTNTRDESITVRFVLHSYVSSENGPMSAQSAANALDSVLTSAGQNMLTAADEWLVSAQMPSGKYLGHLWANDNSNAALVNWYTDAYELAMEFEIAIPAHSTISFMHYMVQGTDQQQVAQQLVTLLQNQAAAFAELTDEQLLTIGNLLPDTDADGLSDVMEQRLGTDPNNADSDGDGLLDGFEYHYGFNSLVAGEQWLDPDSDGLTNLQEQQSGSHPLRADTDGDGLSDGGEVNVHGTNPAKADSDDDGLSDGDEIELGTSPLNADTDGDGLLDGEELNWGTDPLRADSDGDGIADGVEVQFGLDPTNSADALEDWDGDGLTNLQEVQFGTRLDRVDTDRDGLTDAEEIDLSTDPLVADTDGDGLFDGYEVRYGLNPLQADDVTTDFDNDGLNLLQEYLKGTSPVLADTDGDGVDDLHDELPLNPNRTERLSVLLVDDGGNSQMTTLLQSALDSAQLSYSIFNTDERNIGDLTRQLMAEHTLVLWSSGAYGHLSNQEEYLLSSYLNGGGCALYTAQEHHWRMGLTPILSEFFGVSSIQDDRLGDSNITLRGAGTLFSEQPSFSLYYTVSNYSDTMTPTVDAETLFTWNDLTVATYINSGRHLAAFLGFPLEMISNNRQRALVIERMLEQCTYYHDFSINFDNAEVYPSDSTSMPQ